MIAITWLIYFRQWSSLISIVQLYHHYCGRFYPQTKRKRSWIDIIFRSSLGWSRVSQKLTTSSIISYCLVNVFRCSSASSFDWIYSISIRYWIFSFYICKDLMKFPFVTIFLNGGHNHGWIIRQWSVTSLNFILNLEENMFIYYIINLIIIFLGFL